LNLNKITLTISKIKIKIFHKLKLKIIVRISIKIKGKYHNNTRYLKKVNNTLKASNIKLNNNNILNKVINIKDTKFPLNSSNNSISNNISNLFLRSNNNNNNYNRFSLSLKLRELLDKVLKFSSLNNNNNNNINPFLNLFILIWLVNKIFRVANWLLWNKFLLRDLALINYFLKKIYLLC
jgi:hypothetical protein